MADNVTVDNNDLDDYDAATDDVGGKHYQRVKVDLGGDGAASPLIRGQQTKMSSIPVTLASDEDPVSVGLPTDASTATLQTTGNTSLSSIDGKITAVDTGAVVVSSSALPSGAATSANQTTVIGHVDGIEALLTTIDADTGNIDGKITACDTGAVVVSSGTVTANLSAVDNAVLDAIESDTTTIAGDTTSLDTKLVACDTGAVVVSSSALPSGASTSANQTTLIGHVDGIEALLTTIDADTGNIDTSLNNIEADSATIASDTSSIDSKVTACDTGAVVVSSGSIDINAIASAGNGQKTVTVAGTAEALAASTTTKSLTIKALVGNTGIIYVGDSGVSSANGFELEAGESISLDIDNLADISLDCSVSGEGVSFIYIV